MDDAVTVQERGRLGQSLEKTIPRWRVSGKERRRRVATRGNRRPRARHSVEFATTRGTRTFGEIGHERTLGRSPISIVNKFSTIGQKFRERVTREVAGL